MVNIFVWLFQYNFTFYNEQFRGPQHLNIFGILENIIKIEVKNAIQWYILKQDSISLKYFYLILPHLMERPGVVLNPLMR